MDKQDRSIFVSPSSLTRRNDTYSFISPERFPGSLSGQVAVVVGAGRGIGRATALALAAAGASVCVVARTENEIEALAKEITSTHGTAAIAVAADVTDRSAATRVIAETEKALGEIDILINNAGTSRVGPFEAETNLDIWWRIMEINLYGPANFTHAVLPQMLKRQKGTIISTSSASAVLDLPFNTAYGASKAALIKFHQDLDLEVRDRGIRQFTMHPGAVKTTFSQGPNVLNLEALQNFPKMTELFNEFSKLEFQTPELGANVMVALCAEKRTDVLCGKYLDCQYDLEQVIQELEKGQGNRVDESNLYRLKLEEL